MSDLGEAELDELDGLLAGIPAPYRPLDLVALDGYLCGVLVQPRLVEPVDWLPTVFDIDGAAFPARVAAHWKARAEALVVRRYDALRASLEEEGGFDPLLGAADDDADLPEAMRAVPTASRALLPWVGGFVAAIDRFGVPIADDDDAAAQALARVLRHLPAQDAAQQQASAALDVAHPIADEEAAVADLVQSVTDLYDLNHARRWQVETVRRTAPKVGRNDPCPCGSGRKFKHCHGQGS